jgi:acyl-CoA thioesterase
MSTDAQFLGLTPSGESGAYRFRVDNHLARLDGRLYGGTAIAVSITAAELVSERTAVWMTTQFVSTAPPESEISVRAEVLAPGRRTNQVRVTGTDAAGAVMFASLGATGHHREGLSGTFEHAPTVSAPEESDPRSSPFAAMLRNAGVEGELPEVPAGLGFNAVVEFREPEVRHHPDPGPGRLCMWVRRRDGIPATPATIAFMADMVPLSVAHGCKVVAGGISLDNTIRVGAFEPSEWLLVDLRAHAAVGSYGHGLAHIWSERGALVATASQSASMMGFDITNAPWLAVERSSE